MPSPPRHAHTTGQPTSQPPAARRARHSSWTLNRKLNITDGTEVGHASGTYSHWNGYKLDYSPYTCVSNYITSHFTYIGGSKWQSGSGNIYFRESNHWDVTFNCDGR